MHATKTIVYGRYAAIGRTEALFGLALGGALVLGSWTGRKIIERLPDRAFSILVEGMLIISALFLIRG